MIFTRLREVDLVAYETRHNVVIVERQALQLLRRSVVVVGLKDVAQPLKGVVIDKIIGRISPVPRGLVVRVLSDVLVEQPALLWGQ
jgi:hypothetical protein